MRLIAVILLFVLTACGADKKPEPTLAERDIAEVKRVFLEDALDASSIKFRNLKHREISPGERMVCGEVNGKNRFGGYTGYQQIHGQIVGGETRISLPEPPVVASNFLCDGTGFPRSLEERAAILKERANL